MLQNLNECNEITEYERLCSYDDDYDGSIMYYRKSNDN